MGGYKKMEVGKVNVLYVTTDPKKFKNILTTITYAYLTTATETEFKDLLNDYLSENKFERRQFMSYVSQKGYYCIVLDNEAVTRL